MAFIAMAAALAPSIFGAIQGAGQKRQAKRLRQNAVNPGFEQNSGVLQNAETLKNRFGNYQMPGYNQALNNIDASSATAFNSGVQGASSGGDVLDLATKIAYGTGQQKRELDVKNAQGKEGAMFDYLGANVAAGQERQNENAYDRDQYGRQLDEAAALYSAGDTNIGNALSGASSVATSALMNPAAKPTARSGNNPAAGLSAKFANTMPGQAPASGNPLVQYNSLNPILQNAGLTKSIQNNGMSNMKPIIPLPRRK
jgi:hypothetical protein